MTAASHTQKTQTERRKQEFLERFDAASDPSVRQVSSCLRGVSRLQESVGGFRCSSTKTGVLRGFLRTSASFVSLRRGLVGLCRMQAPQMSPYTGTMITTELIQKYLDENKQLILAILDNQNLGKLHECAAYQSKLQQNLMYLAAIADAQPQAPIPTAQIPSMQAMPGSMLQANAQYIQQQQQMTPPPLLGQQQPPVHYMQTPQMALHQAHQAQQQQQHQQQQQRMGLAVSGGMHNEIDLGANMSTMGGFPDYAAAHANSSGNAGDGRNGGAGASGGGSGGDLRAAVTGGGGSDKPNSSQAAGDGVNGDDAGSTFLKASEED